MKAEDDIRKFKAFALNSAVDYRPNSITSKTILKKLTGTVQVFALDSGQGFEEMTSAFDTFIQILDGSARVTVDCSTIGVDAGEAIIIPAHSRSFIAAEVRFKMLSTVIKSGYEDESIH